MERVQRFFRDWYLTARPRGGSSREELANASYRAGYRKALEKAMRAADEFKPEVESGVCQGKSCGQNITEAINALMPAPPKAEE